ncbi:MAG TPA: hypothetical protein DCE41_01240, partial [Cytophagales bacterium]|nr:hypothetical protein [Cytophagales bacterium]
MPFSLEHAIGQWRRSLSKYQGLEPGLIEELEGSLRDRIDDYLVQGYTEQEAFEQASEKAMGDPLEVADEMHQVHGRNRWRRPAWRRQSQWAYLLPNYLKVAFRRYGRRPGYTLVNGLGLVIGMTCLLLAGLYLHHESTWDQFHTQSEDLYRVSRNLRSQGYSILGLADYFSTPAEKQQAQIDGIREVAGVKDACHFNLDFPEMYVEDGETQVVAGRVLETNTAASFYRMFSWKFLYGSAEDAAATDYRVVLTESLAEKVYGQDWLGNPKLAEASLFLGDTTYLVAGVIADVPGNSHFTFDVVIHRPRMAYWGARTYALLEPEANPNEVEERINAQMGKISPNMLEDELWDGDFLQPIHDIHLYSNLLYETTPPGELRYLYLFGIMAVLILLITLTNYTNLAVAMNIGRTREFGMRKVMGAGVAKVAGQLLWEAILLTLLTLPFTLLLLWWVLPHFNSLMGTSLAWEVLTQGWVWLSIVGLTVGTGL